MHVRTSVLATVAAAALALPAAAVAKGPESATMTGPGLDEPIVFTGGGEPGSAGTLGRTAEHAGFFPAVFGQQPSPMLAHRPPGDLGPRYTIDYRLPGPNGETTIRQDVYPQAEGGPVTYMAPGQVFFEGERTRGGWYRAGPELEDVLAEVGLPGLALPAPAAPESTPAPPDERSALSVAAVRARHARARPAPRRRARGDPLTPPLVSLGRVPFRTRPSACPHVCRKRADLSTALAGAPPAGG
jgi:hypothetical protein